MCEIKYPRESKTFTIRDFRTDGAEHVAEYYIHVVNDVTEVCELVSQTWNFAIALNRYEKLRKECAPGWHIELTVGISQGETRAKLM